MCGMIKLIDATGNFGPMLINKTQSYVGKDEKTEYGVDPSGVLGLLNDLNLCLGLKNVRHIDLKHRQLFGPPLIRFLLLANFIPQ